MKSLRYLVLLMAVGAFSVIPARVYAQQEVDPDHFDQASVQGGAGKAHVSGTSSSHHHQQSHHAKLASKHSGGKTHHHQSHAA